MRRSDCDCTVSTAHNTHEHDGQRSGDVNTRNRVVCSHQGRTKDGDGFFCHAAIENVQLDLNALVAEIQLLEHAPVDQFPCLVGLRS